MRKKNVRQLTGAVFGKHRIRNVIKETPVFEEARGQEVAVALFIGIAYLSFEYRFLITTMKRFPGFVLGTGHAISTAVNSKGPLSGKFGAPFVIS